MLHFSLMPALISLQTSKVQIFASSLPLSSIVYSLSLRYSDMNLMLIHLGRLLLTH